MDSYSLDQLTEEVFGHLCNVAIDKCNDRVEKRRAGCGGQAMRKRVLIKNFVSDLLKSHGDKESEEDEEPSSIHSEEGHVIYDCCEEDECSEADTTIIEDEDEGEDVDMEDQLLEDTTTPKADFWLSGQCSNSSSSPQYVDYVTGSSLLSDCPSGRDGALGRADHSSLPLPHGCDSPLPHGSDPRLCMYDMCSNLSEGAREGGFPEPAAPAEGFTPMHTVPAHRFDSAYELSLPSSPCFSDVSASLTLVEPLTSLSGMCDVIDSAPLRPVETGASDEMFLALNNNSYSEMKTYTSLDSLLPLNIVTTPPPLPPSASLTDLDAPPCDVITDQLQSPKKRRSNEMTLFDSINSQLVHQKRIKL